MRSTKWIPGMRTLKLRFGMVLAVLASCAADPAASLNGSRFALCDRASDNNPSIALDYRTKWGVNTDVLSVVEFCDQASSCISSPIVFSSPPRLPVKGATLRWRVGVYDFSIRQAEGRGRGYLIDVSAPPIAADGRSWSTDSTRISYDRVDGVTEVRRLSDGHSWRRCGGRLTFEDLAALRADRRPAAPQPPRF